MAELRLITLDPGHFHAALVQREMYPQVSPQVDVYAPLGPDLTEHMNRIARFNARKENPTAWELEVHCSADYLERMRKERPGNIVVLSGRNRGKIDYIKASVEAGLNVLADKPWILMAHDFPKLEAALEAANRNGLIAFDIMTERYEVTSILQKELVNEESVFGTVLEGSRDRPAVIMASVHHLMKTVAGVPLLRPAWFFDVEQQGEGVSDVATHLVDLVQWTLFPGESIDWRRDIELLDGRRWPTVLNLEEFRRVTGETGFPEYLATRGGRLEYFCNNSVTYALRGVHIQLTALWNYEAPRGAGDTHLAVYRGARSRIEVRQGREENYRPELYVVPNDAGTKPQLLAALERKVSALESRFAGIAVEDMGKELRVLIPGAHRIGHEAHFAQVTRQFFAYLKQPDSLPAWENANMLAKYYVTTKGAELGRERR